MRQTIDDVVGTGPAVMIGGLKTEREATAVLGMLARRNAAIRRNARRFAAPEHGDVYLRGEALFQKLTATTLPSFAEIGSEIVQAPARAGGS
jgi:hypothetical protein